MKLAVLGGSSVAVPELIATFAPYLGGERELVVYLHGRTASKLEKVGQVCQRMAQTIDGLTVAFTTDLADALSGADAVLNQVRVGGLDARAYDETFPHRWNIPGEETVGPGGAANALRTIPQVLDLCRAIEATAPDALVFTFSNPSSVVQRAITATTRLNVIGLCDAPETMHRLVARSLGVEPAGVQTSYLGMHHFGFITSAVLDGEERLPDALARPEVCNVLGVEPAVGRAFGVVPHPYFKYFMHADKMLEKQQRSAVPRARELQQLESELLAFYADYAGDQKPEQVERRSAVWYSAVVVPAIAALLFKHPAHLAVNILNNGLIDNLPPDTIIEISAALTDGHVEPHLPTRPLPPSLMGMLQANAAYERTLMDAITQDSDRLMLQALLVNPLVPSYHAAQQILDEIWPRRGWPVREDL